LSLTLTLAHTLAHASAPCAATAHAAPASLAHAASNHHCRAGLGAHAAPQAGERPIALRPGSIKSWHDDASLVFCVTVSPLKKHFACQEKMVRNLDKLKKAV
jgi:hypothetical protein